MKKKGVSLCFHAQLSLCKVNEFHEQLLCFRYGHHNVDRSWRTGVKEKLGSELEIGHFLKLKEFVDKCFRQGR